MTAHTTITRKKNRPQTINRRGSRSRIGDGVARLLSDKSSAPSARSRFTLPDRGGRKVEMCSHPARVDGQRSTD